MSTPAERLVEAELAYHRLNTGTAVVEVRDSDGESIRYTVAKKSDLRAYIAELKAEIAGSSSCGPMRIYF